MRVCQNYSTACYAEGICFCTAEGQAILNAADELMFARIAAKAMIPQDENPPF